MDNQRFQSEPQDPGINYVLYDYIGQSLANLCRPQKAKRRGQGYETMRENTLKSGSEESMISPVSQPLLYGELHQSCGLRSLQISNLSKQ